MQECHIRPVTQTVKSNHRGNHIAHSYAGTQQAQVIKSKMGNRIHPCNQTTLDPIMSQQIQPDCQILCQILTKQADISQPCIPDRT